MREIDGGKGWSEVGCIARLSTRSVEGMKEGGQNYGKVLYPLTGKTRFPSVTRGAPGRRLQRQWTIHRYGKWLGANIGRFEGD